MPDTHRDCRATLDRRTFTRLTTGAAASLLALTDVALAKEPAGRVDDVSGQAMAELRRASRRLALGESVFVGDTVTTAEASRVALMVGAATNIRLGPEARLRIDRFIMNAGGSLVLQSGPMTFNRPPGAAPQPMTIRGAFGMIAVRGTHFFAGPSRGRTGVVVIRGSVSVRSGGETVILNDGEGTDIVTFGAKPSKPAPWSADRINEALASML